MYRLGGKSVEHFHTILNCICPKMNVIAWLEFELAAYDFEVQYVSPYTVEIASSDNQSALTNIKSLYDAN